MLNSGLLLTAEAGYTAPFLSSQQAGLHAQDGTIKPSSGMRPCCQPP